MELRDFGKRSGLKVYPVSMGAMRFPEDLLDSVELIRYAVDNGLKYIDTSRGYGDSEFKLGQALRNGYREKVILSTKCSPWNKKIQTSDDGSADSVRRRIDESLARLDVDYLDFYQVWNVYDAASWELATKKGGMVEGILKAKAEGLVRHIGFTTHEKPQILCQYLREADWAEVLLVTYNMMNLEYQCALETARELGIGTIVMNPMGGGRFAQSSTVMDPLAKSVGAVSVADMAVRYVYSNELIDTMLCGITCKEDINNSIASIERGKLSHSGMEQINQFFTDLAAKKSNLCTGCNYCQPCPGGVDIARIFNLVYEYNFLGWESAREQYNAKDFVRADKCLKCGKCVTKCTQKIEIVEKLSEAHTLLS